jgi:hypothetical protein
MHGTCFCLPHDFRRISTCFHRKFTDMMGPALYIYLSERVVGHPAIGGRSLDAGGDKVRYLAAAGARGGGDVGRDRSHRDGHPALHPTRIDIPPEIRQCLSRPLNQTLACTVDLRSQVKRASWNVKGKEGSQLQALFKRIPSDLDAYADLLADRLVVLGGVALGTAHTAARHSTLPEYPSEMAAGDACAGAGGARGPLHHRRAGRHCACRGCQ